MKQIICDKCNKVINEIDEGIKLKISYINNYIGCKQTHHLCEKCTDKYFDWINTKPKKGECNK